MKIVSHGKLAFAVAMDFTFGSIKKGEPMDLIYRQQAIDALDCQIKQCNKALSNFGISMKDEYAVKVERASLVAYKEQLKCLPSAQPERKTGHWVDNDEAYECSVCGSLFYIEDGTGDMNFCPNCGAKMEGGIE